MAQINKPSDYFNTNLWTGDDSNPRSITSTHATDFVWIKARNQTYIHRLFDSVRGATKRLRSNGTDAEDTASTEVTAFTSTGYTIDSGLNSTSPTTNWVGWSWLAGGTGVSNTDGSITSTVSVNTTAGFSIVSYTGSPPVATVGHGLNAVPSFMILKDRDAVSDWIVFHSSLANNQYLDLNNTNAVATDTNVWNNTAPTSSVFTVGDYSYTNPSSRAMIAYCFAEKKGFSKFGSYTGNGSTDGPFIYTGFKPAWVMIKLYNTTVDNWYIQDSKRLGYNFQNPDLRANTTNAENLPGYADMLSNGFKLRDNGDGNNGSGYGYIYMAFAENPLVGTNNIPTTAR
jgi:hypothetical protein